MVATIGHPSLMLKIILFAMVITGAVIVAMAQIQVPPAAGRAVGRGGGMLTPYTALQSPEVHPDRTVTLRFRAPSATRVEVVGEILQGKGSVAMTKGEDGVWTATLGPLPPEIWIYNFRSKESKSQTLESRHQAGAARIRDVQFRRSAR